MITILDHLKALPTTEGYYTVKAINMIAENKKIDMPIMKAIFNILYNNTNIKEEIVKLLDRPSMEEFN